ncbi:SusC/RagA family TonB-linked outer membrane protein [Belliella kenyensis]|uniref:SusC/RagA family TonB-linked outer membrane protein n=1 Tax=Belliella kenyensis TaxID=1472724 RepID=A0ABV8EKB2_9BACT|nr:TonB-dependent receptor [Belliella kenyensis]MCH7401297.1 TonB-dependent receptor [Belliella kenyensis]MDN3602742.1 TonB-dependent receptor [Belliella kenyensis]
MRKVLLLVFVLAGLMLQNEARSQQRQISGRVISGEDSDPLPGVNVVVKGTTRGAISDLDGRYSIQADQNEIIVFSFVGFTTQEIAVGNRSTIDITLSPDSKTLGEVVVVGYGSTTKGDLTGNIASVKGEALATIPVPNFQEALQGRMAGVFVESSSGKLGEGVKVRVRGTTSISGGNDPLYVIDGIPMTTTGAIGTYNPLSDINFNDVESFEVLKDASASAIYGARAANGVVLITTKSGTKGKTKFNFGIQRGVASPTRLREFLNASEYVELMREAGANVDDLAFVESRLTRYSGWADWRTGEVDTDWQQEAFNPAAGTLNANFSASGGDEKTRFFFSGAYDKQDGILIRNDFERISGRLNLDHSVSERFLIGANFGLSRTQNNRLAGDNQFNNPIQLVALAPITPIRDLNGQLYDRPTATYYNNLIDSENAKWLNTSFRNISNLFGEYKLLSDLKFRSEFGVDVMNQNEEQFFGSRTNLGLSTNGYGRSRWTRIFNYNTNNYFSYSKVFNNIHNIEAVGGMSFQKSERNSTFVEGQEFPLDELRTLESAARIVGGSSFETSFSFLSYFTRVNYKYGDKYLATISARYDGSSRFGENNKYGFFPAASVGWILSEESFLKGNDKLSLLKLRASYGLTGNAEIGDFDHLGLYGATSYALISGLRPTQIPNPNLTWEKTVQLDLGIEFALFRDRITGELDFYDKNTSDLLLNVPVPATTGFNVQRQNVGKMQNYGFEIVLNSVNIARQNFTWNTSINFARNINRVRELAAGQTSIPPSSSRFLNGVFIDQSIGVFYGHAYAGVDPTNGDALYYIDAQRNETTNDFNEAERMFVGDPNPKFFGGITNNLTFKNFDFSVMFQGVYGNDIFDGGGGFFAANGDWFDNSTRDQLRRWQNPGDITDVPQARLGECNGCNPSSRYISDGSYLRLRTLTLGYTLKSSQLEKLKLSTVRIFFTGQNLLTFTKYKGWDPEVNADYLASNIFQGNDFYSAPQAKVFSLGLNVGF